MTSRYIAFISSTLLVTGLIFAYQPGAEKSDSELPALGMTSPHLRAEWDRQRLADPATGEIPSGIRKRELAFAATLPQQFDNSRSFEYNWEARGPYNFGGRTRALVIDASNEDVVIAGSVSGGIYRSTDQGDSWTRVSDPDQNFGITALAQDVRAGKTNIWYCGSGESYNSASAPGATYIGNGMMKSTDGGLSWEQLESTVTGSPQSFESWDRVWRIATDPTATDDVVLAAIAGSIERSQDGGNTWTTVLGGVGVDNAYSEVVMTNAGVGYAALSSDGASAGIHRSGNGIDWVNIGPPSALGTNLGRAVMAINPSNEDEVYILAQTPSYGQQGFSFSNTGEWNSLWKYTYISGDGTGAGGQWDDLSANIPVGPYRFDDFYCQGGYDMLVAVKPDDPNTIFIGGTNLYRSTDGFTSTNNTTYVGGYGETTDLPDFQNYANHHPDQHGVAFVPGNPSIMFSFCDGGIYKTNDCTAATIEWESGNNQYNTTQFYTVAIDHGVMGDPQLMGGLQDNGTFYTNSASASDDWTMPISYDGAFGAIADAGSMYITSIQVGRIIKFEMDGNGNRTGYRRIDPIGGFGYSFIHPFAMDPIDNNILYLPAGNRVWRNDSLNHLAVNNEWDSISTGWFEFSDQVSGTLTSVEVCLEPEHRVYVGTSNTNIYQIDNANIGDPALTLISGGLGGGTVNCIAADPRDGDKLLAVISNYNAHSLFYSEDAGQNWGRVGGNLEGDAPDGAPPELYHLGDGPSVRWAEIIPVAGDRTVFMIGTSVGLFATDALYPGNDKASDTTRWVQQAANTIGNVTVEMLDYRESDGLLAVATHGSGIWTANITSAWGITNTEPLNSNALQVRVAPNPAASHCTVQIQGTEAGLATIEVLTLQGQIVHRDNAQIHGATGSRELSLGHLAPGAYLVKISAGNQHAIRKILVN